MGDNGVAAIAEVQQNHVLMANSLAQAHQRLDAAEQNTAAEQVARTLDVAELRGRVSDFQRRTFRARLRWLLTGK